MVGQIKNESSHCDLLGNMGNTAEPWNSSHLLHY